MAKPGDFFIGVIDFFAILLPGLLLALFLAADGRMPVDNRLFWPCVLAGGYIAGHLLHALGALLDPILYDSIFQADRNPLDCPLLTKRRSDYVHWWDRIWFDVYTYPHRVHQLSAYSAKVVNSTPSYRNGLPLHVFSTADLNAIAYAENRAEAKPSGVFQWARAWLRTHSRTATAEIDRLEADSKLFRSLTVVLVPIAVIGWPRSASSLPPAWSVAAVLMPLCLWRYCDLRQKMVRMCYLYFVQLQAVPAPRKTSAAGTEA
jgi:hypothetical protein